MSAIPGFIVSGLLLFSLSQYIQAQEDVAETPGWSWRYNLGVSYGGDTLDRTSNDRVLKAGGDVLLGAGIAYPLTRTLTLQGLAGYHYASLTAANGRATFQRQLLDIELYQRISASTRLGLGLEFVFAPTHDAITATETYQDTSGLLFEWNYNLRQVYWWGIRYTDLQFDRQNGTTVDGRYFALVFSGDF